MLVVDLHFIFVSSFHFWSSFCCCFSFVDALHFVVVLHLHFLFEVIPHPSVDYRRVFTAILYFQPSLSQSDSRHFHFQPFRYLLAVSATTLSGHFLPTAVFYLTLLHRHFNLRLSRLPWEPAGFQGFIMINRWNKDPAHLFVCFTVFHKRQVQNDSVLNSTIYYH